MKTILMIIGRIVVILLVAVLVIGVTMRLVDTNTATQPRFDRSTVAEQSGEVRNTTERTSEGASGTAAQSGVVTANRAREGLGEGRTRPANQGVGTRLAFGLFGLLQNFAIIGGIVWVVVWLERRCLRQPVKAAV